MKNLGLITVTLIGLLLLAACKKSKVDKVATNYFTDGGSYHVVPDTIVTYLQNNIWVLHAYKQAGNYQTQGYSFNDNVIISFPGKYRILPNGDYQIVSSTSLLTTGNACVSFSSLGRSDACGCGSSTQGNAIDGQVQVSQLSNGKIRIVFNGLTATNSWWQSIDASSTRGYDTVKLSADLTY